MIRRIEWTIVCVGLITIVIAGRIWIEGRRDQQVLQSSLKEKQASIDAADAREKQTEESLAKTIEQIEKLKNRVQTPAEAAKALVTELPSLPAPIKIELAPPNSLSNRAETGSGSSEQGENAAETAGKEVSLIRQDPKPPEEARLAPAIATVPQRDLKPLFDAVENCRECDARLAAMQEQLQDEQEKSAAVQQQRNAAVAAAKGGSRWTRFKRAAKWIAIGAVVGGLVARRR